MIVQSYDSTQKTLLENPWLDRDTVVLFSLLSDSYAFSSAETDTFAASTSFVGSSVEVTGKIVSSSSSGMALYCDNILVPVGEAAYGLIYVNNSPLFLIEFSGGDLIEFDGTQDLKFDSLLTCEIEAPSSQSMLTSMYSSAFNVLYSYSFSDPSWAYGAQLLSDLYSFDEDHTTRGSIAAAAVGAPEVLSGKTITNTAISCSSIDFSSQGTLDAAGMAILKMSDSTSRDDDELLLYVNFSNNDLKSVDRPVPIQQTGLISFSGAS